MVNFISKDNLEMLKFHSLSIIVNVGRDYRYIEIVDVKILDSVYEWFKSYIFYFFSKCLHIIFW